MFLTKIALIESCYWLQEYFIASPVTLGSSTTFASSRPSGLVFKICIMALVAVTLWINQIGLWTACFSKRSHLWPYNGCLLFHNTMTAGVTGKTEDVQLLSLIHI